MRYSRELYKVTGCAVLGTVVWSSQWCRRSKLTCLRKTIIHWRDRIQIWKWKQQGRLAVMEYPSDIFQYCARWFIIILPLKRRVYPISRAFFRQWDLLRTANEEKIFFYFPSATAAPVRKQLGRWHLLLRFQSRNREKKKADPCGCGAKVTESIFSAIHSPRNNRSATLNIRPIVRECGWWPLLLAEQHTQSLIHINLGSWLETVNRSFLQDSKWRQLALEILTNPASECFD